MIWLLLLLLAVVLLCTWLAPSSPLAASARDAFDANVRYLARFGDRAEADEESDTASGDVAPGKRATASRPASTSAGTTPRGAPPRGTKRIRTSPIWRNA